MQNLSRTRIDGHTFDPRPLGPGAWALDAGCRGFALARFLADRGVRVLALDADPDVRDPGLPGVTFLNAALLPEADLPADGKATLFRYHSNPEAHTTRWGPPGTGVRIPATTLRTLMRSFGVRRFGLMKFDIEGDEYGIMEELAAAPRPLADQISVEYHDFCGRNPDREEPRRWHAQLARRLARLYRVRKQEPEPLPWDPTCRTYLDCWYTAKDAAEEAPGPRPRTSARRAPGGADRRAQARLNSRCGERAG